MKIHLLCVGRPARLLASPIEEYEARIRRYFDLDIVEVRAGRGTREQVVDAEGEALLAKLPARTRCFALTRMGRAMSSREIADELQDIATYGPGGAAWLIGGAYGLSGAVLSRVDRAVSLSELTLPHELARLVLAEQLYRAGTILRGEPYHKGG
jgi:23S rRNA (pseudouridine1915-N3)-methyltransferase